MAAKTQETPTATPGRRYGSFAGRAVSGGRSVVRLTQCAPGATPGRRYGSFAGRTAGGGGTGAFYIFDGAVIS